MSEKMTTNIILKAKHKKKSEARQDDQRARVFKLIYERGIINGND